MHFSLLFLLGHFYFCLIVIPEGLETNSLTLPSFLSLIFYYFKKEERQRSVQTSPLNLPSLKSQEGCVAKRYYRV